MASPTAAHSHTTHRRPRTLRPAPANPATSKVWTSLVALLARQTAPGGVLIVGVTGPAADRTTSGTRFSSALARYVAPDRRVDVVSANDFRSGDAFDSGLLTDTLQQARWSPVTVPGRRTPRDAATPATARVIDRPHILLVEGSGFEAADDGRDPTAFLNVLIYVDDAQRASSANDAIDSRLQARLDAARAMADIVVEWTGDSLRIARSRLD